MSVRRAVALVLLSVYVLFILDLAWLQFPSLHPKPNLLPFHSMIADWRNGGRDLLVNFLGNIVAFIPIGMIPPLARPGRARNLHSAAFCLSLSALIEVVQYVTGRRVADVDDLILNTIGGVLGYTILRLASRSRPGATPDRKIERRPSRGTSSSPAGRHH